MSARRSSSQRRDDYDDDDVNSDVMMRNSGRRGEGGGGGQDSFTNRRSDIFHNHTNSATRGQRNGSIAQHSENGGYANSRPEGSGSVRKSLRSSSLTNTPLKGSGSGGFSEKKPFDTNNNNTHNSNNIINSSNRAGNRESGGYTQQRVGTRNADEDDEEEDDEELAEVGNVRRGNGRRINKNNKPPQQLPPTAQQLSFEEEEEDHEFVVENDDDQESGDAADDSNRHTNTGRLNSNRKDNSTRPQSVDSQQQQQQAGSGRSRQKRGTSRDNGRDDHYETNAVTTDADRGGRRGGGGAKGGSVSGRTPGRTQRLLSLNASQQHSRGNVQKEAPLPPRQRKEKKRRLETFVDEDGNEYEEEVEEENDDDDDGFDSFGEEEEEEGEDAAVRTLDPWADHMIDRHPASVAAGSEADSDEGCNGRLYDLLQTDPEVPATEIKRIFERTILRSQYKEAYRVLSNGDKKRLYDIVGEPVVECLNKSWGDVVEVFGTTATTILYGLGLLGTTILAILFFVFLPVHVDRRSKNFSWHGVLTPLYILFIVASIGSIALCVISRLVENKSPWHYFRHPLGRAVVSILYLIFTFLVGAALNSGDSPSKWMHYFIILIFADCLTILEWMSWTYPKRLRKLFESYRLDNPDVTTANSVLGGRSTAMGGGRRHNYSGGANRSNPNDESAAGQDKPTTGLVYWSLLYGFWVIGALDFILAIIRYVLIGLKCDGDISGNWYGVLTPVALRFLTSILYRVQNARVAHYIDQRTTWQVILTGLGSTLLNALPFISTYLIAGFLEGDGGYFLAYAFIPIYFLLTYFFFASIFTAIYLFRKDREFKALEAHELEQMRLLIEQRRGAGGFGEDGEGEEGGEWGNDDEDGDDSDDFYEESVYDEYGNRTVVRRRKPKQGGKKDGRSGRAGGVRGRRGKGFGPDDGYGDAANILIDIDDDDAAAKRRNRYAKRGSISGSRRGSAFAAGEGDDGFGKKKRVRYGPNGEVIMLSDGYSAGDGFDHEDASSSEGAEVCLSEATHNSGDEEEDHQPFGSPNRTLGNSTSKTVSATNNTGMSEYNHQNDFTGVSASTAANNRTANDPTADDH